jgi:hypothetical protein
MENKLHPGIAELHADILLDLIRAATALQECAPRSGVFRTRRVRNDTDRRVRR